MMDYCHLVVDHLHHDLSGYYEHPWVLDVFIWWNISLLLFPSKKIAIVVISTSIKWSTFVRTILIRLSFVKIHFLSFQLPFFTVNSFASASQLHLGVPWLFVGRICSCCKGLNKRIDI
jgi:hypothetical protein